MKYIALFIFCFFSLFAVAQNTRVLSESEILNDRNYQDLVKELKSVEDQIDDLTESQDADSLVKTYNNLLRSFVEKHPDSFLGLFILSRLNHTNYEANELERLFNIFPNELKNTDLGKTYAEKISVYKKSAIGAVAPDFTLNDPEGNPVSLSDFRGKYVLLDFWASWCPPCRKENVYLREAYNTFKDKNFEIISVSLDYPTGRKAWLSAVQKDSLTWTQVSELKGWGTQAALLYSVITTPDNFLLDPQGVIIGKNLMGKELERILAETLKK
jgi:peroxiredoxin